MLHIPMTLKNCVSAHRIFSEKYKDKLVGLLPNHAIGPQAQYIEMYLRKSKVHNFDLKEDVVLVATSRYCNRQFDLMCSRLANIVIDDQLYDLLQYGGWRYLKRQRRWLRSSFRNGVVYHPSCPSQLDFLPAEEEHGRFLLKKMGVDPTKPFVTISNKDNWYWQSRGEDKPWDAYRCSVFEDLVPAIEYLHINGVQSIRVGYCPDTSAPNAYHTLSVLTVDEIDFMDIYLQKHALFSVCGDSGLAWVPYIFKTPVLLHNMIPLGESPVVERGIFLPKCMRKAGTDRIASLSEIQEIKHFIGYSEMDQYMIREMSAEFFQGSYYYAKYGLEIMDSSPEDILQAVKEMLGYVDGKFQLSPEQKARQTAFNRSFSLGHPMRHTTGWVSPSFLQKNENLVRDRVPIGENKRIDGIGERIDTRA